MHYNVQHFIHVSNNNGIKKQCYFTVDVPLERWIKCTFISLFFSFALTCVEHISSHCHVNTNQSYFQKLLYKTALERKNAVASRTSSNNAIMTSQSRPDVFISSQSSLCNCSSESLILSDVPQVFSASYTCLHVTQCSFINHEVISIPVV